VDHCESNPRRAAHHVETTQMRALSEAELEAYFAQHRAFAGAIETPYAVLVPAGGGHAVRPQ
jgi:hypothetical protein